MDRAFQVFLSDDSAVRYSGRWFHRYIKTKKISNSARAPIMLPRRFRDAALSIRDILESTSAVSIEEATLVRDVTTVNSPSSRYYLAESLNSADTEVLAVTTPNRVQFDYRFPLAKGIPACPNL